MHSSQEDQPFQTFHNLYEDGSVGEYLDGIESVDPFARLAAEERPGASAQRSPARPVKGKSPSGGEPRGPKFGRRKLVTLLAAGTVGVITVVTVGGVTLAHSPERVGNGDDGGIATVPQKKQGNRKKTGYTHGDDGGEREGGDDGEGNWPGHKPTPSPTQTGTPSPTKTPSPTTTPSPTKTPTPPPPTPTPAGTTIGSTSQTTNTAVAFTNPADGQASWLVHMSNGNFVAVEQACTHAGVQVKYNPATGQFNCPAHGAIFNADGTNPQAPATRPLPPVHITVNASGTITTP